MPKISDTRPVTLSRLFLFFLPLGLTASLVTISHVVINRTLTQAESPELAITAYAIAMSLFGITEKPAILLRQTCSALVRDKVSFRAMRAVTTYVLGSIILLGLTISYTPLGPWMFTTIFNVDQEMTGEIMNVYRILMFVSLFSGLRCLYQGIIISNMRTMWLTIGMAVRLSVMYGLSLYFIHTDNVYGGQVGAIIFLFGMLIEAVVCYIEGRQVARRDLPEHDETHEIKGRMQIFRFYRPMLLSSFIGLLIGPAINAMLGKTADMTLAIASFAIAASILQLCISFFTYMHQIVLNFYRKDPRLVARFSLLVGFLPGIILGVLSYTSLGPWFLETVIGTGGRLTEASLQTLRVFVLLAVLFPWLDLGNGLLMLRGQTKTMVWSLTANVLVTLIVLIAAVSLAPGWNGMIGALAQSAGLGAELLVVLWVLRATSPGQSATLTTSANSAAK